MTAGNFFERCKQCRACCRTSDRFVHIYVCGHEKRLIDHLASMGRDTKDITVSYGSSCPFLTETGCSLGDMKPYQCRMYPILVLPDGALGVDPACTFSEEYLTQLQTACSDAWLHFDAMEKEALQLSDKEKTLLAEWSRYVCDVVVVKTNGE